MKASTSTFTGTVASSYHNFFQDVPNLGLQTISLSLLALGTHPYTINAVLSIGDSQEYPTGCPHIIATGVIDISTPLIWTGRIEIGEHSILCVHAFIGIGTTLLLAASTRQV